MTLERDGRLAAPEPVPAARLGRPHGATLAAPYLPVTVSGLGARELISRGSSSTAKCSKTTAVANETAVALSLLHLFIMSICATGFGFFGAVWRQPQRS